MWIFTWFDLKTETISGGRKFCRDQILMKFFIETKTWNLNFFYRDLISGCQSIESGVFRNYVREYVTNTTDLNLILWYQSIQNKVLLNNLAPYACTIIFLFVLNFISCY